MASPKQPSVEQMLEELRQQAVGPRQPLTPIDTARRNLQGMYEKVSGIPGNVKRMVQDPVAYAKSLPAPTGEQIMGALGPGNVGMAGIMIGPKAKTWNVENAYKAVQMEHAGATPQEIWQATGTYRGPEGAWRQEINDRPAVYNFAGDIKGKAKANKEQQAALKEAIAESLGRGKEVVSDLFPKEAIAARKAIKGQVGELDHELRRVFGLNSDPQFTGNFLRHAYEHPELYKAYPELQEHILRQGANGGPGAHGSQHGDNINIYSAGLKNDPKSVTTHEVQHAIQSIENTPRGGNPQEFWEAKKRAESMVENHNNQMTRFLQEMDQTNDPTQKAALKQQYDSRMADKMQLIPYVNMDPFKQYELLAGEAEARAVQKRLNMTDEERRANFPLESYDKNPNALNRVGQNQSIIEGTPLAKAQGGNVKPFDYENPEHVENVASIAAKHRDFNKIPDVAKHLAGSLAQGSYKIIEDPRIQQAIKLAGHSGYFINHKSGKEHIVHKAAGGTVPSIDQMRMELDNKTRFAGLSQLQSIGVNEAPSLGVKAYVPPQGRPDNGEPPVGGVDMSVFQPGQQLMPPQQSQQPQQPGQAPQGMPGADGQPPMGPKGGGNILQMTPQGQALAAIGGGKQPQQQPQQLAEGGQVDGSDTLIMTPQGPAMDAMGGSVTPETQGLKEGGTAHFDKGGMAKNVDEMRLALANKYNPMAVKASEALGKHEGKTLKVTQADRTKVGGGFLGGPGFSSLQHVDPRYKNAAWGVNTAAAASKIANAAGDDVLWSALIGAPTQHTSNQMVFDLLLDQFKKGIKSGKMSPELRAAINARLAAAKTKEGAPIFENADIAGKNFFKNLNTFDKRRVMADLMGGQTVGGKKGQIFDYDKIVRETTEPELLGAPTHAIGPRLFKTTGERSFRPDLHPAFPHILHGEDLGVMYHPVPREVMLPEFHEQIRQTKGRPIGFMDLTRNTPAQFLSEKFLTGLQKQGYKKGGGVKLHTDQDTMALELSRKSKKAK